MILVVKREVLEKLMLKYPQLGEARTLREFHEKLIKFAKKEGYKVANLGEIENENRTRKNKSKQLVQEGDS